MKKVYLALLAILMSMSVFAQTARVQVIHNSPTPPTTWRSLRMAAITLLLLSRQMSAR